ncbi:MAG: glutamine synthetase [SAR202 cluster bacterium]|nr:glutamine synthetase [SAR202 cluster bacterium]
MMAERNEAQEYVLAMARESNVKFIRLWFVDILGNLKGFAITVEELEDALTKGVVFDGASIEGFTRISETDMVAMPDPSTFRILPWRPKENAVARMFCDILTPDGQPFPGDPRFVLKRNLQRAAKKGFTYYVGPEIEFFYLKGLDDLKPLDRGDYFDQLSIDPTTDMRRDTVLTLREMDISVKYSHHEGAPGQHEIDLQYTDALTMADHVMTARTVIKEVAYRHHHYATFMPKPFGDVNGSGMHIHQSLFSGEDNAFFDDKDPYKMSHIGKRFIAGLIKHAPEITLVTNQWINSYKRLVPGFEAPIYISWAWINRGDLIRVPAYKPGRPDSVHIEYRAPDPSCNPYLAFSAMLAVGLAGIDGEYETPPALEKSASHMTEDERREMGIRQLPQSLWDATGHAERSGVLAEALGSPLLETLIQNKKIEWDKFHSHITDYELQRYLPML